MILKWWLQKYHSTWSEVDGDYRIEQRPYTNHGMVLPLPSHLLGPQNTACSASAVKPATTENICIWRAGCWWVGVAYTVKCNCFPKLEHPRFGMRNLFVTSPLCGSSRVREGIEAFWRWSASGGQKGRVFQQHPFRMIIASSGNPAITWNRKKLFWLRNQITQGETTVPRASVSCNRNRNLHHHHHHHHHHSNNEVIYIYCS